jgi:transcriptional regulator with XRE-family HTH domain
MSAADFAAATGIKQGRLDAIEAGRSDPAYDVLLALAQALGVETAELVARAERLGHLDAGGVGAAFGRRLRNLRTERGFTQERLARRTGLHRTALSKLDHGLADPLLSTVLRLAHSLDVKPCELVEDSDASEGGDLAPAAPSGTLEPQDD